MKHRFRFIGQAPALGHQHWLLSEEDAFHAQKVLRLAVGDEVEVADGFGRWCVGTLVELTNRAAIVQAVQNYTHEPTSQPLVLAMAAMKPASFEEMLPSLVELGVDKLWIFAQTHTDRKWFAEKVLNRWQRIVISAMKQCKRPWLPELQIFSSLEDLLNQGQVETWNRYVLEAGADQVLLTSKMQPTASILVIGSEKGLTESEKNLLFSKNFVAVRLGSSILRAFTASLAATAVISAKRDTLLAPQSS